MNKSLILYILLALFLISSKGEAQHKYVRNFVLDFQKTTDLESRSQRFYILNDNEVLFKDVTDSIICRQGKIYGTKNFDIIDKFIYYAKNKGRDIDYEEYFKEISAEFISFTSKGKKDRHVFIRNNQYRVGQAWDENRNELLKTGTGMQLLKRENGDDFITYFKDSILIESYSIRKEHGDTIYSSFDKIAEPKNGFNNFYEDIRKKMNIPSKFYGKTYATKIQFIVNKKGKLEEIVSLRKDYEEIDDYIIQYMKSIQNWNPAFFNDKPVKTIFQLPIKLEL